MTCGKVCLTDGYFAKASIVSISKGTETRMVATDFTARSLRIYRTWIRTDLR